MFAWKKTKAARFWIIAQSLLLLMCLTKLKIGMSDPPTLKKHCLSTWRLCPALKEITIFISTTRITKKRRETSIRNRLKISEASTNHNSSAYHWFTQRWLKSTSNSYLNTGSFPRNHIWMCGVLKKSLFAYLKFHICIPKILHLHTTTAVS